MLLVSAGCEEQRSLRFFQYQGRYALTGSAITFRFDASNRAWPWEAHGAIDSGWLAVTYNDIMMLADFEDGVFVRTSGGGS